MDQPENHSDSVVCDRRLLLRFANAEVNELEQQQLASHLCTCAACARELETLIDREAVLNEWHSALTHDDLDTEWQSIHSRWLRLPDFHLEHAGDPERETPGQSAISAVVALLHPSEHPNSLGRYAGFEISGVIGAGGMGVVLKGLDVSLQRTVALKVLSPQLAASALARRYFVREGQAAASILHPNVIPIHQVSEAESLPVIVMPYLGSETLQSRIDEIGWFEVESVLRISRQIAAALEAAHHQGVIHRDIKPANILLERNSERIVVTDFGLARVTVSGDGGLTEFAAGTPSYMSPEQARGESVDPKSDLFSLGSVMYAMCTGHAPFRANNSLSILRMVNDDRPPPIVERNPAIPLWLIRLIEWLHQKQPEHRPCSAGVVIELLDQCIKHWQAPEHSRLPAELVDNRSRHAVWRWGPVAVVTIALMSALVWPWNLGSIDPTPITPFRLRPEIMERAFVEGSDQLSVGDMLRRYKESEPHSTHESETANYLRNKYAEQIQSAESEQERIALRQAWAQELLPLVISELPINKATFFRELCSLSSQVRDYDHQAKLGMVTPPLDWELQVVRAFVDAHQKYIDDARSEIELVLCKARANVADSRFRDQPVEFQGKRQTLQSIIVQLEFYQKIIEALSIQTMGQD